MRQPSLRPDTRWEFTAGLIVRRVPDERTTTVDDQVVLFPVWRYHVVFIDSPFVLVQAEEHHRGHAVIEQVFAELIDGPLAHLPSGLGSRWRGNGAVTPLLGRFCFRRPG